MLPTMTNGRLICLELKATSKEALFDEMAQMLARDGAVSDQQQFVKDIWAREQLDCTGFEQGVALPHAKSKAVSRPAIAIGVSRQGPHAALALQGLGQAHAELTCAATSAFRGAFGPRAHRHRGFTA